MNTNLLIQFEQVLGKLIEEISSFSQDQFNRKPFEGSWTAGQVAQHLNKSYGVIPLLKEPVKRTERAPDQNIPELRESFLNFTIKMQSPEFILPEEKNYDKEAMMNLLDKARQDIAEVIRTLDLSETCTGFAFPVLGEMTRLEILHFIVYHTLRHTHQLQNILKEVQKADKVQTHG